MIGKSDVSSIDGTRAAHPEANAIEAEWQARLAGAVARLNPSHGQIYRGMKDGKNLRQLALELGVSYRTIKRRWRRAISQLRKELSPYADELCG